MNQTVDILCRARALYASAPSHIALPDHPDRGTYCMVGALIYAAPYASQKTYDAASDALRGGANTVRSLPDWNAEHSTEEVLAAFDRAIAAQRLVVPPLQRAERRDPVHTGQES